MTETQPHMHQVINDIMYEYNQNIRDYNANIRLALTLLSQSSNTPTYQPRTERRPEQRTSGLFEQLIRQYILSQPFHSRTENVVVRPTLAQIAAATETFVWPRNAETPEEDGDNMVTQLCPIMLEPFQPGEEVCQIRHCGHTFKKTAITDWFRRNVRCPVCRYDISESTRADTVINDPDAGPTIIHNVLEPDNVVPRNTGLLHNISNALRTFISSEVGAGTFGNRDEISFTFDIPSIPFIDPSLNQVD